MKSFAQLKVLVADDHFLIREFVRLQLWGAGILHVLTADNGEEAIDCMERAYETRDAFDILFLDWNMPAMSGLDVLRRMAARPEHAKTAFVMLTAESEQGSVIRAIKAGAMAYIVKPVSPEDFGRKLRDIHDWLARRNAVAG